MPTAPVSDLGDHQPRLHSLRWGVRKSGPRWFSATGLARGRPSLCDGVKRAVEGGVIKTRAALDEPSPLDDPPVVISGLPSRGGPQAVMRKWGVGGPSVGCHWVRVGGWGEVTARQTSCASVVRGRGAAPA